MKSSLMKLNHVSTFSGEGQVEIIKRVRNDFAFCGSNSGLLCRVLPLFVLDKIVQFAESTISSGGYDGLENVVWKMLVCRNALVSSLELTT